MDVLNEKEIEIIEGIIKKGDYPVLMMNLNRYKTNDYKNDFDYLEWRKVNAEMIKEVDGKILWILPVEGQLLVNGRNEPIHEILAYWYPSHQSLLDTRKSKTTKVNFELRKNLIDYAIIHRCDGKNPPLLPEDLQLGN